MQIALLKWPTGCIPRTAPAPLSLCELHNYYGVSSGHLKETEMDIVCSSKVETSMQCLHIILYSWLLKKKENL